MPKLTISAPKNRAPTVARPNNLTLTQAASMSMDMYRDAYIELGKH